MPRRTLSRLGALARGLVSLLLLLALLIGVPALLLRTGVLPEQLPTWQDVTDALTSPDNGTLFLGALTLLGWAGWVSFVVSTLVETGALLRHRSAPRIQVLGATQRLAASLVAGVVLLLPAGAAFAAAPTAGAVAVTAPVHAGAVQTPATGAVKAADTAQAWSGPSHQVRSGDTLWDLAEQYLGSGQRWHEIADLNDGLPQPDGSRFSSDAKMLQPGWTLRLPADAVGTAGPAAPADTAQPHTVTVHAGDTLSAIAEDELGDGDRYAELLKASEGIEQNGGRHLTDADNLFPGDVIVIPGPAPVVEQPAAAPAPTAPEEQTVPADAAPVPTGEQTVPAAPPAVPATPEAPAVPAAPETAVPAPDDQMLPANAVPAPPTEPSAPTNTPPTAQSTPAAPATENTQAPITVQQGVGGIAALLGAGALGVIAWRRRGQQRDREPRESIAMPEETAPIEQLLNSTANPTLVELLDRALRTLAHHHPDELPTVIGARVQSDRVEILVEDPDAVALAPFTDRPGGWWGLRGERATLLSADEARNVPAPYPGLATIGTDPDGVLLLANLPQNGVLLLDGNEEQVREVARGIAMEAGTALWADHIEVITSGFGLELQRLLPQCRIMFVPHLAGATADLARVLVEVHQAQHEGGSEPLPWMVVCAGTPSPEELYEFADVLGKVPAGQRIAAVLPAAGQARNLFPDAQVLDASLVTQAQPLEVLDDEVVLQRVTDEAYRQLTATLTISVQPAVAAEGVWGQVPDPDAPQFGPSALHSTGPATHLSLLPSPAGPPEPTAGPEAEPASEPGPSPATAHPTPAAPASPATPDALSVPTQSPPGAGTPKVRRPVQPGRVKERPRVSIVREGDVPPGPAAPQVQVLGPLRITGIDEAPIQPRLVLLAALLIFKSDRDYGAIANHMDPVNPWTPSTMDTHMSRLRRRLGVDSTGTPYLRPKPKGVEQYSISDEITCDYANFEHLAERGLPRDAAGVLDLEAALRLVRGRPFGGAGAHTWAAPLVQTMKTKIVTVAHTIAYQRIQDEVLDIDAARHAISVGLAVEPAAEVLFRDWMRIEKRAGNPTGLKEVIAQVRQMVVEMGFDHVHDKTEALIQQLTATRGADTLR